MSVTYTALSPQPAGLTTGEVGLQLAGTVSLKVAVKVERWIPDSGSGTMFTGTCRFINSDGTSGTVNGKTLTTTWEHSASEEEVASLGANAIDKELVRALVGASPTLDGSGHALIPWDTAQIQTIGELWAREFTAGMSNLMTSLGL